MAACEAKVKKKNAEAFDKHFKSQFPRMTAEEVAGLDRPAKLRMLIDKWKADRAEPMTAASPAPVVDLAAALIQMQREALEARKEE